MNRVNPFNITTAVDYSDEEINRFWVNFDLDVKTFSQILNTESPMPMIILGGKGSGKTHIMRYFSFNSKKIRYGKNFIDELSKDKYVGIYLRCGGLDSSRFQGAHSSEDVWKNLFGYYIELWFSQLLLQVIDDIFKRNDELASSESVVCKEIIDNLFDTDLTNHPHKTFAELKSLLRSLQKEVDYEINNCSITGKNIKDVRISITPGTLLFGVPKILQRKISVFNKFQFIYLIDEYENLLTYQQKYVNTLLRERQAPVTFRVGARWYGIKTYRTFSGEEEIKEGSEYEMHIIDKLFRENDKTYEEFINKICLKRLKETGYTQASNNQSIEDDISEYYEEFHINDYLERLKQKGERIGHFVALRSNLKGKLREKEIEEIIKCLTFHDDILIERTNVFLFYRSWRKSKGANLLASCEQIRDEAKLYFSSDKRRSQTRHFKALDKFKNDIVDQLFKESQDKIPYTGFDKLVKMSNGIPRLLLITLKHIYRWSVFNNEDPFRKGQISIKSQMKGVDEASMWFIDDARIPGPDGRRISDSMNRLGQFLQELRFADTPPECSLCAFSINVNDISEDVRVVLDYLEQYSYIISVPDRTEKNSVRKFETFQINGIIAPRWDLPLYRRGIIQLTKDEVVAIFNSNDDSFEKLRKAKMNKHNAPFSDAGSDLQLFDDL